jgi:hypothetical protein
MEFGLIEAGRCFENRPGAVRNRNEASNRSGRVLDDDKIITIRPYD